VTQRQSLAGDPLPLVAGAIAAQVIGGLVTQLSPFVTSGLMAGLALSERAAGFVVSVELIALAVTAIASAPWLPRFSYRRVSLVAVALTLLAQSASLSSASVVSLALLRGLAGAGQGVLYAVSLCIVASGCRNPDKIYGIFQMLWAVGSVALFSLGGELTQSHAHRGVFALIVGVSLVFTPLLLLIPDASHQGGNGFERNDTPSSPRLGVMAMTAIVFYVAASAALYVFSAPLGERAGLDTRAVGYALTVASLVGLAGAGAATAINVRWGRAIPISVFCGAFSLIALVVCLWRNPTVYVAALIASVVIYYFSIPYLFGLAAALDGRGRWAAAAGSAYLVGFAAGPATGGAVIAAASYAGLGVTCVVLTASAWGLAIVASQRVARNAVLARHGAALPTPEA
jgi:predicted MFS family arabinose efflux permease